MYFRGEYWFLSNFYPCLMEYETCGDKAEFLCAEAAYQAQKCVVESDKLRFSHLNGAEAKSLGRIVTCRPDWERVRGATMYFVLQAKFSIPELRDMLLSTGDKPIVHDNNHGDRFWGKVDGYGADILGILLTDVRKGLIDGRDDGTRAAAKRAEEQRVLGVQDT